MRFFQIASILLLAVAAMLAQDGKQVMPPNPASVPSIGGGGSVSPVAPATIAPSATTAKPATTTATTTATTPSAAAPLSAATGTPATGAGATDVKSPAPTDVKGNVPKPISKSIAGVDDATYVIGAQDTISVSVWKEPELSGSLPVRPDGMISMSLLNDVRAAGFTPMQLAADITERLRKFVQDPEVSVTVTGVNSKRIYILGEVGRPGPMALQPSMTVLQALASSGGLSPYANGKKIYILRNESGGQEKLWFNYKKALKGDNSKNILLKPDDTIVVP